MQQKSNTKSLYSKIFVLGIFIFVRSVVFIQESRIGFNVTASDVSFTGWNLIIWVLLLFFAFLIAVVMMKINNSCDNESQYICALIIADPIFFLIQNNGLKLTVIILCLFFVFSKLRSKSSDINDMLLCLCLFVSAFFMPYTVFCFAPLLIAVDLIPKIDSFYENKKQFLSLGFKLICIICGIVWNKLIFPKFFLLEEFVTSLSFNDNLFVLKDNLIFLTGIPAVILGVYFFFNYYKDEKKEGKNKKSLFVIGIVILLYALCIAGYIINGIKSFYTFNLIIPTVILTLVLSKDENACTLMKQINMFIQKHIFVMLLLFIVYNAAIFILRDTYFSANIVSHII